MVRGAGAIVVLGCRVLPSGEPSPTLARRARVAARAYREGVAPCVVAAGGRRWEGRSEASVIAAELAREGVPRDRVILELCSLSTTENAIFAARILRSLGATRALIATSAWHMRRALVNFRAAGVEAEALAMPGDPPRAFGAVAGSWWTAYEIACSLRDRRAMRRATTLRAGAEWIGREPAAPHGVEEDAAP